MHWVSVVLAYLEHENMRNSETVWIDVTETGRSTDKAMLLITDDGEKWVPRSQMKARRKNDLGAIERLEVTRWWAEKEGLADPEDDR